MSDYAEAAIVLADDVDWEAVDRQQMAVSPWRSMEDAPKDGTRIHLRLELGETVQHVVPNAWWDTTILPAGWAFRTPAGGVEPIGFYAHIAHWCPGGVASPETFEVPLSEATDFDVAFPETWPTEMLERARVMLIANTNGDPEDRIVLANIEQALAER